MDLGITGKVALVTGASSGLGKATAQALVAEGALVAISGRSRERVETAAQEIGATGFVWDAENVDGGPTLLDDVARDLGAPVEILVCNTGGPPGGMPLEFDNAQWEQAYRSLVLSPMTLIRSALPVMQERGWGRVLNIVGTTVREPNPALMLSSAHRASMITAFKTLARAVAADGVTLNSLLPGRIATGRLASLYGSQEAIDAMAAAEIPAGRAGTPQEFAAVAAFLCSAPAAYVTGETMTVDGGLTQSIF
ncbi:SDR family oxidoreductase [Paraconexibacter sp.]|uniref:SDR family oxidoreductase n=1 Tax=Paraconexibacter sp. TaxID=2949640 RepID=UPI003566E349